MKTETRTAWLPYPVDNDLNRSGDYCELVCVQEFVVGAERPHRETWYLEGAKDNAEGQRIERSRYLTPVQVFACLQNLFFWEAQL